MIRARSASTISTVQILTASILIINNLVQYPGYEAHSGTPDDTESYNLLLRDLRQKLDELGDETGKFYGLTAALPCGTNHIGNIGKYRWISTGDKV